MKTFPAPAPAGGLQRSPASPSIADAGALIVTWDDLPNDRRRTLASALSFAALVCAPSAGDRATRLAAGSLLPFDCASLNQALFSRSPASHGISKTRFTNILSALRFVLRRLDLHAPKTHGRESLSPSWQVLHDALPGPYRRTALIRFLQFCTLMDIEPPAVAVETLSVFELWCVSRNLQDGADKLVRETASNWNWASQHVAGWPTVRLSRPRMRDEYTLQLDAYPASFRADLEIYMTSLAGTDALDLFPDDAAERRKGRRRTVKPRTLVTRRYHIRQAAAALVLSGVSPDSLTALADLVQPTERARRIITFFLERAGGKTTTQVTGIAETLRQIAVHHATLSKAEVDRIAGWKARVTPPSQMQMNDQNAERLKALLQPRARAMLLHLPAELMRRALQSTPGSVHAARVAAYAAALEILLVFPMRRDNLAGLRLDRHLQRLDGRGGRLTHIFLEAGEVKNGMAMQWPLPADTASLIDTYLQRFRPFLAAPTNPFLFVGAPDKQRMSSELANGLSGLIEKEIGTPINLHLLRHFAVALHLEAHPGEYEIARQLLGHAKVETTRRFYAGLEAAAAARHFDQVVERGRAETRVIAAAAFGRVRGKRVGRS